MLQCLHNLKKIMFPSYICKFFQDIGEYIGSNSNKKKDNNENDMLTILMLICDPTREIVTKGGNT